MPFKRIAGASVVVMAAIVVAGAVAWAGGQGGGQVAGVSVMLACAAVAFVIQWVAFVPAYLRQTEHFYDLVGSLTYITVTAFAIVATRPADSRSMNLPARRVNSKINFGSSRASGPPEPLLPPVPLPVSPSLTS